MKSIETKAYVEFRRTFNCIRPDGQQLIAFVLHDLLPLLELEYKVESAFSDNNIDVAISNFLSKYFQRYQLSVQSERDFVAVIKNAVKELSFHNPQQQKSFVKAAIKDTEELRHAYDTIKNSTGKIIEQYENLDPKTKLYLAILAECSRLVTIDIEALQHYFWGLGDRVESLKSQLDGDPMLESPEIKFLLAEYNIARYLTQSRNWEDFEK